MTPTGRPTVTCGACGKTVAVKKDGTLWHHRSLQPDYPGSVFRKVCHRSGTRPEAGES